MFHWHSVTTDIGKLVLAAILGGLIGIERESHGQAAGFRTYFIVSTGSCLMMLLSLHIEDLYRHVSDISQSVVRIDPGRIASYAIASMGFLGAGAIIKGKGSVRGLTTAAGLWIATGIGLSIGAGNIYQTLFATSFILLALYLPNPFRGLVGRRIYSILTVKVNGTGDYLPEIKRITSEFPSINLLYVNYDINLLDRTTTYQIRIHTGDQRDWTLILQKLSQMEKVEELKWMESDVP